MIRSIATLALLLTAISVRAAEPEAPPCAETDFECLQQRESARFHDQIEEQKAVWLERWTQAKARGEAMLKEQKLDCGKLDGMERMKCRVETAKKLSEWKKKHDEKKAEYLDRIEKLKADFAGTQMQEDSMWTKVKDDFSEKAKGIKDQLLGGDTVAKFFGPGESGESLESRVNQALEKGAGAAIGAADGAQKFAEERRAQYEKLKADRESCRSASAVSSCLQHVGESHDQWKQEFEARKKQAEEAAAKLKTTVAP
ncbi:MAG: hypothetical protein AUJ52_15435 [Elusimicrobia bacterium CG1_02_63_36]|nr:MAG: hypothetical protein AUJ52_15435 [Elusimicrobia bacterium CG1_02_63_36]PIP84438.1 MAG: hypothetical protein COR54_04545 [Elusimicrobia bacterium CG22_combo_CG10-13_8_21_14_all_63_91]PJA18294.1 MAG: hypothetical protein COX66_01685 [Elusimicrobia bacterium CG_4_10_14_0_2_um_filter_63_34]PJB23435.1 MAG: hypothetical protein CO113_18525 [Elusimicrobia bacterium CG_4_9_14_3_um_filter_62_55]